MALQTETYNNILQRWCSYTGIEYADLLTNEQELFKQFGQARLRKIWREADWPDVIDVSEEALTDQAFVADATIGDILGVYEYNPLSTFEDYVKQYKYRRVQDDVYVYGHDIPASVFVVYRKRVPAFAVDADTVPYRFSEYIARGAYADWLRTERDTQNANIQESFAKNLMDDELEILELDERNSQWTSGNAVYTIPRI